MLFLHTKVFTVPNEYHTNRLRCAKSVLSGKWDKEVPSLGIVEQEKFCKPLMETDSKPDTRDPVRVNEVVHGLGRPISISEVLEGVLKSMQDGGLCALIGWIG